MKPILFGRYAGPLVTLAARLSMGIFRDNSDFDPARAVILVTSKSNDHPREPVG
jgi:hypothetical protein